MLRIGALRSSARLYSTSKDKFSAPIVESLKGGTALEEPTPGIAPHENAQDAREAKEDTPAGPTLADVEHLSPEDLGGGEVGERALGDKGQQKDK
ncbi:hypothetical protein E3P92_01161 [Wallemia ichthyophaga]|uniref:Uncharacterized protein n=2 Tax=Wallemia ichthyophaga TaxID=245174 RepID=A0A4T0JVM0_WALIC|nr:uncharacterized protein J056_001995 [Wallemia ichthyophaga EXF-994]TIA74629.1 hypothetical protein E3P91_00868 [Wallemia ichthyophaga]EOR03917.1 hypothetical protein J056_001995 [Wallemia ichthyophaga EXF-994]TIA83155.1 hypothetical protein E3P98_01014 [Wallemia ichthyophaga]TIA92075.1 hypothetical protein E3P97_01703 [Wallemia ichthyophaga]TIA94637.1 hypothetical protein E3P96_04074 [Wallemia ichthyophaga]